MYRLLLLATLLLLSCISESGEISTIPAPDAFHEIRTEIIKLVEEAKTPSFAVGVLHNGEVIWNEAFEITPDSSHKIISTHTSYPLASMSKSITATLVMKLVEDGQLSLEDPLSDYLPEQLQNFAATEVTVKNLLNMTAGIPHGWIYFSEASPYFKFGNNDLLKDYGMMVFPKGVYEYSNYSFGVIEAIIEKVSEMPYEKALQKYLFDPIEMDETYVKDRIPNSDPAFSISETNSESTFIPSAGAGVHSTINDLLRYASLQLKDRKESKLNYESIDRMHYEKPDTSSITALGWGSISLEEDLTWLVSNGSFPNSANSNISLIPQHNIAVVCLANKDFQSSADMMAIKIVDVLLPGFAEKAFAAIGNYEASNRRDLSTMLGDGEWRGRIKNQGSEYFLEVKTEGNTVQVSLDGEDWQQIEYAYLDRQNVLRGGGLKAFLRNPVTNEIEEATVGFNLLIEDKKLEGYLSARFQKDGEHDLSIPYFTTASSR